MGLQIPTTVLAFVHLKSRIYPAGRGAGKKIGKKGFNLGTEILMQGSKLKVSGAERLTDAIVEKKKAENKQ